VSEPQRPNNEPFVSPPPPTPGNPMYPPNVLAAKAAEVASEVKTALILSIVGLFCFGFIFGFLAYRKATAALETIALYEVAQDKKSLAMTAKVLSIVDIVAWILGLIARFTLA
jgi:hypothetical protein